MSDDMQQDAQFLTTEHFVLQTARSGTIQEATGRANLFVASVSSAAVALGFVAQVTQMGQAFLAFALIILPSLYFIGIVSFVRSVQVAIEDMAHARGMARIRHFFVERSPGVRSYLVHSAHDDYRGTFNSFGLRLSGFQSFMTTAGMVNVISSVIAGVFVSLAIKATISLPPWAFTLAGTAGFFASAFIWWQYEVRVWTEAEQNLAVRFPSEG